MKQGSLQEKTLLEGMRRGDPAAFTVLVDTYGGKIHSLARRYASNESDAEDLTQETLIEVCRSIHSFRGEAALSTFIYRVAINRCLKYRERQNRLPAEMVPVDGLPLPADDTHDPARQLARQELSREVSHALSTLSDGHREVVILHEMHDLTYAECATILNIPIGTVKSRLFNAFIRLRERLSSYVQGEESQRMGSEEILSPKIALGKGATR